MPTSIDQSLQWFGQLCGNGGLGPHQKVINLVSVTVPSPQFCIVCDLCVFVVSFAVFPSCFPVLLNSRTFSPHLTSCVPSWSAFAPHLHCITLISPALFPVFSQLISSFAVACVFPAHQFPPIKGVSFSSSLVSMIPNSHATLLSGHGHLFKPEPATQFCFVCVVGHICPGFLLARLWSVSLKGNKIQK